MRVVAKSFATSLLAAACAAAVVGCDTETHKADKHIRGQLKDAQAERSTRTEAGDQKARALLDAAAKETSGSPATRAQLAATRAQLQLDAALELMRQIDAKELELSRISFNLGQLAIQLDSGAAMANGYGKFDPKAIRDKIAEQITAAQGGPDKPTWEFQSSQMPTLATVKQKISDLEGELAKLQEQTKTLTEQRTALVAEAEAAAKAADEAKGQASVDEYKRASGLQKQAGDLYTQIDATNARMVPIQADLSVQQGQLEVLNNIIKQLQTQSDTLDAGWKSILQQIDSQNTLAKEIVGAESGKASGDTQTEGATVALKSSLIKQKADELRALRQSAQGNLDDAAKLFGDAYNSAETARRDLTNQMNEAGGDRNRPDIKSMQSMIEIVKPQSYRLREAATRRMLAALYASEAASLTSRANLESAVVPIIQRAGASVPADLQPGTLAKDASTATNLADEAFKAASELLGNIINGDASKDVKEAARVDASLTLYGQSQVARLGGSTTGAQGLLQEAITARNEAIQENIKLPALPAELGSAPAPVPANAAAPNAEPATAPTTEPATEPSSAAPADATAAPADAAPATQPQ